MLWLCIRLPALVREACAASEREALERLAAWAYQWSSLVSYQLGSAAAEPTPSLLWLELGASRALFGEPALLLERIEAELSRLGYTHACAIAPSPTAAALLTSIDQGRCALTCEQLRAQLAPLSLSRLELPTETLQALHSAGLRSIGEVLALPAAALARRFGPHSCHYLARLTAEASDPRPAFRLPERYRARYEFEHELQETTGLLFPLQRLLQEFQGYLRARDRAVQCFTLELEHAGRAALPATAVPIGLSAPARSAAHFMLLARERLQHIALAAPVRAVTLTAENFSAPSILQADLFGGGAQPLAELSQLLDRLRARLGNECVQSFQCLADHRPERACRLIAPEQAQGAQAEAQTATPTAARPGALLPPQRIQAPASLLRGPERIESGWWDGAPVMRDYYVARAADGTQQWVFHDLTDDAWYLQGLWV